MHGGDRHDVVRRSHLGRDLGQLIGGTRMRGVLQSGDLTTVVVVADPADEEVDPAAARVLDGGKYRGHVERFGVLAVHAVAGASQPDEVGAFHEFSIAPGVLVPPHGVYAARALLPEGEFPAVTNIGVRPTVSSEPVVTVESHLLGFDGNLYGRTLALEFFDFLRPERRFADLDELGAQIARDGERARQIVEARR